MKDSVIYGSSVYRNILNEESLDGRMFSTKIQMLPDQFNIQKFEALINQAMLANPDLIMFIDPFQLMRVAKEDVKLAEAMFRNGQKKMLIHQRETAAQNQQQTIDGQIAAAKSAEEEKRKTKEFEMDVERERTKINGQSDNQSAVLNMVTALLKPSGEGGKAGDIPASLQPLVNAVVENIMVGAIASTEEQKAQIIEQMKAAREQEMMQQEQMQQQNIQQPQPQMVA
jgi:hypothetical protein